MLAALAFAVLATLIVVAGILAGAAMFYPEEEPTEPTVARIDVENKLL
jgi:hypothetical protein